MHICVYLFEPKFALIYSKMNCTGPVEAVFEYGVLYKLKHSSWWKLDSGFACNSFFLRMWDFFFAKITLCRPSTS